MFREVSAEYPDVSSRHLYIDALAMMLVQDPGQFDVIVTNNLFGDIVTDIGGALQGGLGMAASAQPPSRAHVDVRAGARLRAATGWPRRSQSDWRDSVCGADAGDARSRRRCRRGSTRAVESAVRDGAVTGDIGAETGHRRTGDGILSDSPELL